MSVIEVGSARVTFRVDGDGPGLVLVHGTGGNAETNWSGLVEGLSKARTVVRPDYAGSGETTDDGHPLTVAALADQVIAAARAAKATPVDIVGFSLGAALSTYIAGEYPELVRSVVLLAGFTSSADPRQVRALA
jgi:3-oxoadipate enol-lactonase